MLSEYLPITILVFYICYLMEYSPKLGRFYHNHHFSDWEPRISQNHAELGLEPRNFGARVYTYHRKVLTLSHPLPSLRPSFFS